MTNPRERNGHSRATAAASTLIVTNLTKLVGTGVFINEAVFEPAARNSVLALCALFVLGAQVAENVLLRVIDRLFAVDAKDKANGK